MKIQTVTTKKDLVKAMMYLTFSTPLMKMIMIMTLLICFLILISDVTSGQSVSRSGQIYLIILLFLIVVYPAIIYMRANTTYKTNKALQNSITYEFSESSIKLDSEHLQSCYTWDNVYQVRETSSYLFIYPNKYVTNILPKRYFSDCDIVEFRKLVKQAGVKSKLQG